MKLKGNKNYTEYLVRVRYADTDQMGYVYYGNYARFYEIGRVEHMRRLGVLYKDLEKREVMLPVVHMESKFIRPAMYDEQIVIRTWISAMTDCDLTFITDILNKDGKLMNRGKVRLCFVDANHRKKITVPEDVKQRLTSLQIGKEDG